MQDLETIIIDGKTLEAFTTSGGLGTMCETYAGKVEELKADARESERLNKRVYQMMARNCGKPEDYFTKIIHDKGHADWFLDADEAIEHGLCQHKRVPELKVNVTIDIDIE